MSDPAVRPLRLGIAGLGVASTLFLPGVARSPHAKIVAAADLRAGALDAFRAERVDVDHGLAYDATAVGSSKPVAGTAAIPWLETFRMAKELGDVSILACSGSLDVLGIDIAELDPLVDSSGGIAAFLMAAEDGQILFI